MQRGKEQYTPSIQLEATKENNVELEVQPPVSSCLSSIIKSKLRDSKLMIG